MKMYHLALIKGKGHNNFWSNGHGDKTVILQARQNKDLLSPQTWQYLGHREVTKRELIQRKNELLDHINHTYNTDFTKIIID